MYSQNEDEGPEVFAFDEVNAIRDARPEKEFPIHKCINCQRQFDIRDIFFLNEIPYCPLCVTYPQRMRLNKNDRQNAALILEEFKGL